MWVATNQRHFCFPPLGFKASSWCIPRSCTELCWSWDAWRSKKSPRCFMNKKWKNNNWMKLANCCFVWLICWSLWFFKTLTSLWFVDNENWQFGKLGEPHLGKSCFLRVFKPPFFCTSAPITHSVSKLTISAALNCHALWRQVKVLFMKEISVLAPQNPHFPGKSTQNKHQKFSKNSRQARHKFIQNCNNNNKKKNVLKPQTESKPEHPQQAAVASGCYWLLGPLPLRESLWKLQARHETNKEIKFVNMSSASCVEKLFYLNFAGGWSSSTKTLWKDGAKVQISR